MKLMITAATEKEIALLKQSLNPLLFNQSQSLEVQFHISGVGMLAACFSIAQLLFYDKPDLVIQAGIGGTFNPDLAPGTVVAVKDEYLGDTGVEENNQLLNLFDLGLQPRNDPPFTDEKLTNHFLPHWNLTNLPAVTGVTVNEVTTRPERIMQLKRKYQPVVESMEGACLHYCCLKTATPFVQIRAISNVVGERDKRKWAFGEAFQNQSQHVTDYINKLHLLQGNI